MWEDAVHWKRNYLNTQYNAIQSTGKPSGVKCTLMPKGWVHFLADQVTLLSQEKGWVVHLSPLGEHCHCGVGTASTTLLSQCTHTLEMNLVTLSHATLTERHRVVWNALNEVYYCLGLTLKSQVCALTKIWSTGKRGSFRSQKRLQTHHCNIIAFVD